MLAHLVLYEAWLATAPAQSKTPAGATLPPMHVQLLPPPATSSRTPAPAAPPATAPAVTLAAAPPDTFIASTQLDQPVLPKSEPDLRQLEGLSFTGYPIRLRLFIDTQGRVVDVAVLQVSSGDEEAVEHMKTMFLATAYVPGLLRGRAVPSRLDIELSLGVI